MNTARICGEGVRGKSLVRSKSSPARNFRWRTITCCRRGDWLLRDIDSRTGLKEGDRPHAKHAVGTSGPWERLWL